MAQELDQLLERDAGAAGLKSVPEFGRKTATVLRAELGDVARFARVDQVVASVGLDHKAQAELQMERPGQALQTR